MHIQHDVHKTWFGSVLISWNSPVHIGIRIGIGIGIHIRIGIYITIVARTWRGESLVFMPPKRSREEHSQSQYQYQFQYQYEYQFMNAMNTNTETNTNTNMNANMNCEYQYQYNFYRLVFFPFKLDFPIFTTWIIMAEMMIVSWCLRHMHTGIQLHTLNLLHAKRSLVARTTGNLSGHEVLCKQGWLGHRTFFWFDNDSGH